MSNRRVGIYGGAFDPLHEGHLALATAASNHLALDQLLWVPTGKPAHKPAPSLTVTERYDAIEAVLATHPSWQLCPIEIDSNKTSYTSDTLQALCTDTKTTYFTLIGADQAIVLDRWHRLDIILSLSHIAIAPRDNIDLPNTLPPALKARWHESPNTLPQQTGLLLPIPMQAVNTHSSDLK